MTLSVKQLEERINYRFVNEALLYESLTHPSFSAENRTNVADNQRLEFLGDAVLQIVVTNKIFHLFPDLPEGELTKIRSALTKEGTLAQFSKALNLGRCLRLGHGERINKGHERDSILSDAFEALIGAIYIDHNHCLKPVEKLVHHLIDETFGDIDIRTLISTENPKGLLQEWSQKHVHEVPVYELLESSGPDHEKVFTIGVKIKEEIYGIGKAKKRQSAEEVAARGALKKIQLSNTDKTC